jgi:hypothetical protein
MHLFEYWSLLDVQLQISGRIGTLSACIADPFDVDATLPQRILQTYSVAVSASAIRCNGVGSGKCRRTKDASTETPLLIGKIDQSNRNRRPATKLLRDCPQHLKACKNP